MVINDELNYLLEILPKSFQAAIFKHSLNSNLIEVVLDLGRKPEARFFNHTEYLSLNIVTWQDLDYSVKRLGSFNDNNRVGIERTLHRISCIRNREGLIIGLTCRVGRVMYGTINGIRDLLESSNSFLILGRPGVGKTTMIREIARVLSNEVCKRVIIIDSSNEIGGDSDVSHKGIGRARRMHVPKANLQHHIMIEAIQNHMPQVIVIDEISDTLDVLAAKTIAERGVQLIGTAHGNSLQNLIRNPLLSELIGGVEHVTLSDEEARRRGTQKTVLERRAPAVFQTILELNSLEQWTVHENVDKSVDLLLNDLPSNAQIRTYNKETKTFLINPP